MPGLRLSDRAADRLTLGRRDLGRECPKRASHGFDYGYKGLRRYHQGVIITITTIITIIIIITTTTTIFLLLLMVLVLILIILRQCRYSEFNTSR